MNRYILHVVGKKVRAKKEIFQGDLLLSQVKIQNPLRKKQYKIW